MEAIINRIIPKAGAWARKIKAVIKVMQVCPDGKERSFEEIADVLADAVITMWEDPAACGEYCKNAMEHARDTHDREKNYGRMIEIYENIKNA